MGAKQSKRSVDISGKEAEGGGEVAAAGAGGEGRVEQLADADALKPQLNGDAHIQNEQTDKEKDLDSGTPENEKDATTEKEGKDEEDKENEVAPVTNGETEPKVENGDSTPEDGKKPKKEKVKKKWSLRSISFSRKDKPKQEKKLKEEEPKTNGEPEKVPEETAEATPEAAANEVAEEAKAPAEEIDEKTPETPVTEPLTNGTSTPESSAPAEETAAPAPVLAPAPAPVLAPAPEPAPAPAPSPPAELTPEPVSEPLPEPDQLPVNGLSLEESKPETTEVEKPEEIKPELPVAETAEIVPVPEIPKEVCVEQMPLLEPTPPPLPANPPPSSVASFAATTMAPELTDASLANTADAAIAPLSALPDTKHVDQPEPPTAVVVTETLETELPSVLKESNEDIPPVAVNEPEVKENVFEAPVVTIVNDIVQTDVTSKIDVVTKETSEIEIETKETPEVEVKETFAIEVKTLTAETVIEPAQHVIPVIERVKSEPMEIETLEDEALKVEASEVETKIIQTIIAATVETDQRQIETVTLSQEITESLITQSIPEPKVEVIPKPDLEIIPVPELEIIPGPELEIMPEPVSDIQEVSDESSLPPPPPVQDDEETNVDGVDEQVEESLLQIPEPIVDVQAAVELTNGVHDMSPDETIAGDKLKSNTKNGTEGEVAAAAEGLRHNGDSLQYQLAALQTPQEPLPLSEKLADLIPEVPDVPELKTETLQETVTDVAVAN